MARVLFCGNLAEKSAFPGQPQAHLIFVRSPTCDSANNPVSAGAKLI